ncbi:PAS domain S-box-containing protein [Oxalobacteraceae bacterium GrIS 2.11]
MNSSDDKKQLDSHLPPASGKQAHSELPGAARAIHSTELSQQELQLYQLELEAQNESLREAKLALAESRDRYADLFEFVPVGCLTLSEQGQITAVNLAGAEVLGGERETLMGKSFAGFLTADSADRWHLHLMGVLRQDEKQVCELTLTRRDGSLAAIQVDSRRRLQNGSVPTVHLVLTDLTRLKHLEFEMEKTQELAHIGSWYWNATTGEQQMSREMLRIFGREQIPLLPDQRGVLYAIDTWEYLNSAVVQAVQSGVGFDLELPALRADGSQIWVNIRCNTESDASGAVRGLRGTVQDITLGRRATEQTHFQARLLNTIGQAVIATDTEGIVTYINGAAEQMYGWPSSSALGRSILDVTVPDVSLSQANEIMGQLRQGLPWSGEFDVRHRDGRIFTADVHDTPILDPSGKLIGIIGASSDISLRKQTEQSLARSTERYYALFESMDEGFCIIEMIYDADQKPVDWRFLEVNPAFERQNGLYHAAGKRISELAENMEASWFEIYGKVARTGEPIRFQNKAEALGGRWFDLYAFQIGEPGSSQVAILFKDITASKKVQESSQVASRYARSLIEASLDPLVTISADGKITDVNEASVEATGIARELLIGTDFSDYFTDPDEARAGYLKAFSQGFVRDYPLAVRHTNGRIIDVLYNATVFKDDEGNVLGVFAAARDVTVQKQSSRYARSLLEASLDPLVTINANGTITDVNEASVEATGIARELLIGTDFSDYFTDPDEARAGYLKAFSEGLVRDYPLAVRHASGRVIDVLYNATVFKDDKGNVLGVFAAARDVTERNRLDQVLKDKNVELLRASVVADAANLAKSNFLSSMSHELRTPLNAVLGFAQLLEIGTPPPTVSQQESLSQIIKGGWYLLELINEILDLSQIESGKATLSFEPVSLGELMLDCRNMIASQARQRGITMSYPAFDVPCFVSADRTRLKQVLINLLSNAIKYNQRGGTVDIALDYVAGKTGTLRITVRDSGPGMSPEQISQLFQPFNRLGRENGTEEGSGIGLVVTKQLIELMGGRIGVESVVDAGSTFWVELALVGEMRFIEQPIAVAALPPSNASQATTQLSVLYVEDNPANLALVQRIVARRPNLQLLSATNGTDGIERARSFRPQVILMDINLPGISGLEVMRILRTDPATEHIPIIAVSANAMPRDIANGLEAGFFDYLTKPIMVDLFLNTLDMALDFAKTGVVSGTGNPNGKKS